MRSEIDFVFFYDTAVAVYENNVVILMFTFFSRGLKFTVYSTEPLKAENRDFFR